MASDNKTEQATPQRRRKAREKGQVVRSRELSSTVAMCAVLVTIIWQSQSFVLSFRNLLGALLHRAQDAELKLAIVGAQLTARTLIRFSFIPLLAGVAAASAASLLQGGFVFSTESILPKAERISPAARVGQLFSLASVSALLKSLVPLIAISVLAYRIVLRDWGMIVGSGGSGFRASILLLLQDWRELAWKAILVLLLWSAVDYLLARLKQERELRMSRDEIREEAKENEGNPQVKAQIRRMQRQSRRRQMLRAVEHATLVVTNPTHFAVALEYKAEMAAPTVSAKGQNLFAQQIKEIARWHEVPVVENPPLAQALYRTVEVGQMIPAKLYVAVAEILAFIYRTQQRVNNSRSIG